MLPACIEFGDMTSKAIFCVTVMPWQDFELLSLKSWKRPISKMSSGSFGPEKSEKKIIPSHILYPVYSDVYLKLPTK